MVAAVSEVCPPNTEDLKSCGGDGREAAATVEQNLSCGLGSL